MDWSRKNKNCSKLKPVGAASLAALTGFFILTYLYIADVFLERG